MIKLWTLSCDFDDDVDGETHSVITGVTRGWLDVNLSTVMDNPHVVSITLKKDQ